mgnify:CR=1 FL=1
MSANSVLSSFKKMCISVPLLIFSTDLILYLSSPVLSQKVPSSLSFNADFRTSSQLEHEKKQHEMMYESMKKMKESENDKSADVSNVLKSG